MSTSDIMKQPEAQMAYDKLEEAIKEYFKTIWTLKDATDPGEYIGDWTLVAHYGDLDDITNYGYVVEASMNGNAPPHVIRGMLVEGLRWCDQSEDGRLDKNEE